MRIFKGFKGSFGEICKKPGQADKIPPHEIVDVSADVVCGVHVAQTAAVSVVRELVGEIFDGSIKRNFLLSAHSPDIGHDFVKFLNDFSAFFGDGIFGEHFNAKGRRLAFFCGQTFFSVGMALLAVCFWDSNFFFA